MKIEHNVSAQEVSWVKSNKECLQKSKIDNLYYPESTDELIALVKEFQSKKEQFDIIGWSSNTLFLPSYHAKHLICTKKICKWVETDSEIICDSGVPVSQLAKYMVEQGLSGYEGLVDLPGTIASGVYGNCGCYGCSVLDPVKKIVLLDCNGSCREMSKEDLAPQNRSTKLKRGEIKGVVLKVVLDKVRGNKESLLQKSIQVHERRKLTQPSAANNLGTTFVARKQSFKGLLVFKMVSFFEKFPRKRNREDSYRFVLTLLGKSKFVPYIYSWKRYMFLDAKSHELFPRYRSFVKSLFKDFCQEIEIRS